MSYNKTYVCGLHPHLWYRAPNNPWSFLSDRSHKGVFCDVNEVIFWTGWGLSSRSGAKQVIRELEISVPFMTSGEGRWAGDWVQSPVANDLINWTSVRKPPQNPKRTGFRASRLVNTWKCGESGPMEKTWKLCSPSLAQCISSIWLFLSYILL